MKIVVYPRVFYYFSILMIKNLKKKEFVFRSGEIASEMYFIVKGKAKLINENSKEYVLLKKCDYFGEIGIISGTASIRKV